MALFPLPTAAEVRSESDLEPAEASSSYLTDAQLDADIALRITAAAAVVDAEAMTAASQYATDSPVEDAVERYQAISTEEIKLRAVASLYFSAGALNDKYDAKAKDYERRAEQLNALRNEGMKSTMRPELVTGGTISLAPYAGLFDS